MLTNFREELERTGTLVYTNKGVSMRPLLRQGRDLMVIRSASPPYQINDAVLFLRDNGQYVLHRIRKVERGRYYIIGDNCASGEWVREDQILGLLTEIRRGRHTVSCTSRPYLCFVRFWWAIFPLRRMMKRLRFRTAHVYHRILG